MSKLLLVAAVLGFLYVYGRRWLAPRPAMPREEAARLLGVTVDADPATVAEAHRRLIAKVHPDSGGSALLAAQVNRARDVMLKP